MFQKSMLAKVASFSSATCQLLVGILQQLGIITMTDILLLLPFNHSTPFASSNWKHKITQKNRKHILQYSLVKNSTIAKEKKHAKKRNLHLGMAHSDNDKEHIITKDKTPKGWDHVKIGDRRVVLTRSLTFSSSNCH